jgi:hypothetical protein
VDDTKDLASGISFREGLIPDGTSDHTAS